VTSLAVGATLATSCVQQQVTETVAEHAMVEGRRYAEEVEAQSPFDAVEMSWSEAATLMRERNRDFVAAHDAYREAVEEKPGVKELAKQVKDSVQLSFDDVFKPDELLKSLSAPATQLPRQLASLGKLKDLSHEIEGNAWKHTAASVDAELKMREETVKLHRLLRMGELIDAELERVETAPPLPADADPKLVAARKGWRGRLRDERKAWLSEVRDLFDAEYYDVHFVRDNSGLPTYRRARRPDLTEWRRWCRLRRSKALVQVLSKAHRESKPAVPGARIVTEKLAEVVHRGDEAPEPALETEAVRSEVRTLIQNWREMKEAQAQAEGFESGESSTAFDSIPLITGRQALFRLREREIQHASVVWMMDEKCWQ